MQKDRCSLAAVNREGRKDEEDGGEWGGQSDQEERAVCACVSGREARPREKIRVRMAAMHLTVNKHITTPCDLLQQPQ